jgi:hypothetical protein
MSRLQAATHKAADVFRNLLATHKSAEFDCLISSHPCGCSVRFIKAGAELPLIDPALGEFWQSGSRAAALQGV